MDRRGRTLASIVRIIPQAVLNELLNPAAPALVRQFVGSRPPWLHVVHAPEELTESIEHLDPGEMEAILLMEHIGARLLLMDDRAGVAMVRNAD